MWLLYNDYLIAYQSYVCLSLLAQNYVMSLMSRPTNEWETVPPSILLWATYHSISGVKHFLELLSCRISMHLYTFDVQKTSVISERIWFQYVVIMIEKRSKMMYSATIMLRFRCEWQHCKFFPAQKSHYGRSRCTFIQGFMSIPDSRVAVLKNIKIMY